MNRNWSATSASTPPQVAVGDLFHCLPSLVGGRSLAFRIPTADRDGFQRYVCHTLKRMSCQTPVIVGDRKPSGGARGTPSRRQVTYVPYDPSFEMPDGGWP